MQQSQLFLTFLSVIFVKYSYLTHKSDVFMTFGERLTYARKQKGLRQFDLGKPVGTSGDIIGKYERGENMPSIEVVSKMADALAVTIDYLVKDGVYENIDSVTLKRLREIEKLPIDIKEKIYFFIDTTIGYHKTKQALGS